MAAYILRYMQLRHSTRLEPSQWLAQGWAQPLDKVLCIDKRGLILQSFMHWSQCYNLRSFLNKAKHLALKPLKTKDTSPTFDQEVNDAPIYPKSYKTKDPEFSFKIMRLTGAIYSRNLKLLDYWKFPILHTNGWEIIIQELL